MFRLVIIRRGYPLALAGEYTASTFSSLGDALKALGPYRDGDGSPVGTFNPRHPGATEYFLVARSTKDSSLAVVTDTEE